MGQHGRPSRDFDCGLTIFNPILLCIRPVIEKHPSATNTVVRPVVDRAAVLIRLRAIDVGPRGAVIELARLEE